MKLPAIPPAFARLGTSGKREPDFYGTPVANGWQVCTAWLGWAYLPPDRCDGLCLEPPNDVLVFETATIGPDDTITPLVQHATIEAAWHWHCLCIGALRLEHPLLALPPAR